MAYNQLMGKCLTRGLIKTCAIKTGKEHVHLFQRTPSSEHIQTEHKPENNVDKW